MTNWENQIREIAKTKDGRDYLEKAVENFKKTKENEELNKKIDELFEDEPSSEKVKKLEEYETQRLNRIRGLESLIPRLEIFFDVNDLKVTKEGEIVSDSSYFSIRGEKEEILKRLEKISEITDVILSAFRDAEIDVWKVPQEEHLRRMFSEAFFVVDLYENENAYLKYTYSDSHRFIGELELKIPKAELTENTWGIPIGNLEWIEDPYDEMQMTLIKGIRNLDDLHTQLTRILEADLRLLN